MYVPAHFKPEPKDVRELLLQATAADLITATVGGLLATMLPLAYDEHPSAAERGEHGALLGHVARNNDQWRQTVLGEALAIVRGPDAYISPSWYATKREHGRVVPTWNYITAHVYGELVVHDDAGWVAENVRRLSEHHETIRALRWSVDDAPPEYIAGQLRAIVGVELVITRVEAKFKLSQNRSREDADGAIAGLEALGDQRTAGAMRAVRR